MTGIPSDKIRAVFDDIANKIKEVTFDSDDIRVTVTLDSEAEFRQAISNLGIEGINIHIE
ncbi:hypothetical protein KKF55_05605 [Patescibacteria group bacterium]|nr:hypothetical protein [Patescibacteria group bacterium]